MKITSHSLLSLALLLSVSRSFAKVEDFQNLIVESTTAKESLSKSLKNTVERVERPSTETGIAAARPAHTVNDDSEVENIVVPSAGLDAVPLAQQRNPIKHAIKVSEDQQSSRVSSEIIEDGN